MKASDIKEPGFYAYSENYKSTDFIFVEVYCDKTEFWAGVVGQDTFYPLEEFKGDFSKRFVPPEILWEERGAK